MSNLEELPPSQETSSKEFHLYSQGASSEKIHSHDEHESPEEVARNTHADSVPQTDTGPPEPPSYPPPLIFAINMFAMYLSFFCLALDNTIISTAIPQITDQFHALNDVGWYGSAYLLCQCIFLLQFGKIYSQFSPKWTFLTSLLIFELGSLISGVAPNSLAFIFGRAIAGVGASGVYAGCLIIITFTSPLEKRPIWQSLVSGVFGIASVLGPLIGGAFTDSVTWRWCFYINLPIGGVTAVLIIIFLRLPSMDNPFKNKTLLERFLMLDPFGLALFLASMICLFIALQWGGTTYAWSDGRIIALFVVFGVTLIAFGTLQWWLGEKATIPIRIATQRTIWSASWFAFFISGAFFLFIYFVPIYFQAVKGVTALQSGIDLIPLILANAATVIASGFAVSRLGYVNPFCYASIIFTAVGSGLLMTMTADTSTGKWIGYQILFGVGCGLGFQQPPTAAQAALRFQDLPVGIATTLFSRSLGCALFIVVGNNILDSKLLEGLEAGAFPGVDPEAVLAGGATALRAIVPSGILGAVVDVYDKALQKTFQVGLIISCIAVVGVVFIEWKSVRAEKGAAARVEAGEKGLAVEDEK